MTLNRRRLLQAGAAAGTAALMTGCNPFGGGSGPEAAGPPKPGGTLRVGAVGRAASVVRDPLGTQTNESDYLILSLIYDTLTIPAASPNVAPRLAKSWQSSPDLRTWRFEIADGAKFHDGAPVTSEDVVWSLRKLRQSASGSSRLPGISPQNINTDGPRAVVLQSDYPNNNMPVLLRLTTFVMKKDTQNPAGAPGTGPFKLDWFRDGNARLVRNDDFYAGKPLLDAIEVRMFESPQSMANALLSGEIDLASNVGSAAARSAEGRDGFQVIRRPNDMAMPIVMRAADGPFADPRVREAFRLTVDRDAMVKQGLSGYGTVANDIMGTADPLYAKDIPQRKPDIGKANRLLDEAGFDRSKPYQIQTSEDVPGLAQSAALFAKQMQAVGVKIEVVKQESGKFLGTARGKAPLYTSYWGTNDSLYFCASKLMISSTSMNDAAWRDPEFDAAVQKGISSADASQHRDLMRDMQRIQHERSGYLLWGMADGIDLAKSTVQDLPRLPGYGRVQLERTWLSG